MQAMLLAAGMGSRLKELTHNLPKCLVEVGGKPILEWNLLKLKRAGATKIVINVHYLKEQVVDFLKENQNFDLEILLSDEPELLNTGGGLKQAESLFDPEKPILVANADILCGVDLTDLYQSHIRSLSSATLLTKEPEELRVLLFEEQSRQLAGWRNKATGEENLITTSSKIKESGFCGIQVISPVIFTFLGRPEEKRSSIQGYLDAAKDREKVIEHSLEKEYWFDIGTPEQLQECRSFFSNQENLKEE